jgi:hypothetical protein
VSAQTPPTPTEQKPLARPASDLLWGGLCQIVLAIVFGVVALTTTHRPAATAAGLAFEAIFYGGFMWWFGSGRLRREVEAAPLLVDPRIRDRRTTATRLLLGLLLAIAIFTVATVLSPGSPIVAGIALGGGAYTVVLHRWVVRWEAERAVEVLRIPAWRRRKGVNHYRVIHVAPL